MLNTSEQMNIAKQAKLIGIINNAQLRAGSDQYEYHYNEMQEALNLVLEGVDVVENASAALDHLYQTNPGFVCSGIEEKLQEIITA